MSNKSNNASLISRAMCIALRDNEIINKTCNVNGPHTERMWHLGVLSRIDEIFIALRSNYYFASDSINSRKLLSIRVITPEIERQCSISATFSQTHTEKDPINISGDMYNADEFIHSIIEIATERINSYARQYTHKFSNR